MKKTLMMAAVIALMGMQTAYAQSAKKKSTVKSVLSQKRSKSKKTSVKKATTSTATATTTTATGTTSTTAKTATASKTSSVLGSLGNILGSVTGLDKMTEQTLVGTWTYSEPGVSFTSDNLLAKAGGEVAASEARAQLKVQYDKAGISSENTSFTFNDDKTFKAEVDGRPLAGTWSLDESSQTLSLKMLLLSMKGYVRRTTSGLELTFESKKALTLFQTLTKLSGNQTASAIGDLSKNYEGVRIGFILTK